MDERELIHRAAEGDEAAFEALISPYWEPLTRLCLHILADPDEAADAAQETIIKAWRGLAAFRASAAFSTWLYRLATNACTDALRRKKRARTVPIVQTDESGEEYTLELPDGAPTPEQALLQKERRARLLRALERLEPQQRELLSLRIDAELSYEQIAELLHIRVGTVKSRLSRAREKLRFLAQEAEN